MRRLFRDRIYTIVQDEQDFICAGMSKVYLCGMNKVYFAG